ncbi:polysaccharide deacetylase family protein [Polynucleobacter difficilis]|uniref:hypothetical protein n=1 Tax=Polynucleobacter difficilis TaxID=556054 RepID=UPI000D3851FA|nr:hypothetical protein [Polynucleobacter difficilis]
MTVLNNFTLTEYEKYLKATKAKYPCVGFEVLDYEILPDRFAIIRHDVDMSPYCAIEIARIEARHGVRATYTIILNEKFYNPFEISVRKLIAEISELGHDIGLHFDPEWHDIRSEVQLSDAIRWEADLLNKILLKENVKPVKTFSFHNTTPFSMKCQKRFYASLRNAYAGDLQKHVQYISDSNGFWRHRSWDALLMEDHPRIQILTHPEWWMSKELEPAEKVCNELSRRAINAWHEYRSHPMLRSNDSGLEAALKILPSIYGHEGDSLLLSWLSGNRKEAYLRLFFMFERRVAEVFDRVLLDNISKLGQDFLNVIKKLSLGVDLLVVFNIFLNIDHERSYGITAVEFNNMILLKKSLCFGSYEISAEIFQQEFDKLCEINNKFIDWIDAFGSIDNINPTIQCNMGYKNNDSWIHLWLADHQKLFGISSECIEQMTVKDYKYDAN